MVTAGAATAAAAAPARSPDAIAGGTLLDGGGAGGASAPFLAQLLSQQLAPANDNTAQAPQRGALAYRAAGPDAAAPPELGEVLLPPGLASGLASGRAFDLVV